MLSTALKMYRNSKANERKLCVIAQWVAELSEEDASSFEEALVDYSISNRQLLNILKSVGAPFSLEALRKHRNEECPCQA